MAAKYSSGSETYPEITKAALLEMNRQAGVAKPAKDGIMYRCLMIRHLVMPNGVSGIKEVIEWIAENLPKDTYLNIMSQYNIHLCIRHLIIRRSPEGLLKKNITKP